MDPIDTGTVLICIGAVLIGVAMWPAVGRAVELVERWADDTARAEHEELLREAEEGRR